MSSTSGSPPGLPSHDLLLQTCPRASRRVCIRRTTESVWSCTGQRTLWQRRPNTALTITACRLELVAAPQPSQGAPDAGVRAQSSSLAMQDWMPMAVPTDVTPMMLRNGWHR